MSKKYEVDITNVIGKVQGVLRSGSNYQGRNITASSRRVDFTSDTLLENILNESRRYQAQHSVCLAAAAVSHDKVCRDITCGFHKDGMSSENNEADLSIVASNSSLFHTPKTPTFFTTQYTHFNSEEPREGVQ